MSPTPSKTPNALLHGALDALILRSLADAEDHGYGISRRIETATHGVVQVEHGSLYPALYRLEKNGCITSKWEQAANGREMRLYRLTAKGRKQLTAEASKWNQLVRAMARMLKPV